MTNSADSDQLASTDLDLHCLLRQQEMGLRKEFDPPCEQILSP